MKSGKAIAMLGAVALLSVPLQASAGTRPTVPASAAFLFAPVLAAAAKAAVPGAKTAPQSTTPGKRQSRTVEKTNQLLGNILSGLFTAFAGNSFYNQLRGYVSRGAA